MSVIAFLSLAIWVILLVGRGGFWRSGPYLPDAPRPVVWPTVKVVIPARDEAATIRQVVEAHGAAPYDGALSLVVGDDSSTDGTADEVRQAKAAIPVDVVAIPALPTGWTGKLWALHSAMAAATENSDPPDYFLLTDADILPAPNLLQQLVALAEERRLDLVSVMARLDNSGFWGGLLIPAFIFFFQKLYPFPLINDPKSSVAGAAGGVVLIRRQALERIGGIAALRGALIDDCTLAQLVKSSAADTAIGLYLSRPTGDAVSLRPNDSYSSMETMVTRSAYAQLGLNPLMLILTLLGLALVYLAPAAAMIVGLLGNEPTVLLAGAITIALMTLAYLPTVKLYGGGLGRALTLPLAALIYGWFTWLSGWRHMRGRGNAWKGRHYGAAPSPPSRS